MTPAPAATGISAVVLLGGSGTRLRPLTLDTPKQVLPIVGVPMVHRVLAHLGRHGVNRAVLSLGYLHQEFVGLFPDGRFADMEVVYAVEPEPLDTGGAIRFAADQGGIDERFLVANGDILTDLDVTALVAFHDSRPQAMVTVALAEVPDPSAYGLVLTTADGRVEAFLEKPAPGEAPAGNLVNAGTYVFETAALERIATARRVSVEREVFPQLVSEGFLFAFRSSAYWTDTGTPSQYLEAQLDLLHGRRSCPPAPGAVDHGGVWHMGRPDATSAGRLVAPVLIGAGARVGAGAIVEGSVIGADALVHDGATVADSVLLAGAEIGPGAVVRRSIVGALASVGSGASVTGLSVIGGGATVEPGSHLDGARLPEGD